MVLVKMLYPLPPPIQTNSDAATGQAWRDRGGQRGKQRPPLEGETSPSTRRPHWLWFEHAGRRTPMPAEYHIYLNLETAEYRQNSNEKQKLSL